MLCGAGKSQVKADTAGTAARSGAARRRARAFWLKQLHQWHWMSSALCLLGMIGFAVTGITLNHAGQIEGKAEVTAVEATVPAALLESLGELPRQGREPLPQALDDWLVRQMGLHLDGRPAEWSPDELYIAMPQPGGDAWLSIDLASGKAIYERSDRGWIAYLNDLHKGRNTGAAWSWFIDIFAIACLVFSLTGLLLLQLHSGSRPATWPIVGLGAALPLALALFLIH